MLTNAVILGVAAHPGWGGGWGGGFGWFFLLIPLFWILFFVIIFAIFGRRWRRGGMGPGGPGYYGGSQHWAEVAGPGAAARSAERTLAERFAQGDIDEVEYRARLEVLRANRPDGQPPA